MEREYKIKLMWRWSLLTAGLIVLFWTIKSITMTPNLTMFGPTEIHLWELVYLAVIMYCIPLMWLGIANAIATAKVMQLPTWQKIVVGLGILELTLLRVGFPLILIFLLVTTGAPISAVCIASGMLLLAHASVFWGFYERFAHTHAS